MNVKDVIEPPPHAALALIIDPSRRASKNVMRKASLVGSGTGPSDSDPEDNERFSVLARDEPPLLDEPPLRGFGGAFFLVAVFFFFCAAQGSQPPPMESSESPP